MKRIVSFVFIFVFLFAFPVSLFADTDRPEFKVKIDQQLNIIEYEVRNQITTLKVPASYKYRMVLYGSPLTSAGGVTVLYFETPNPPVSAVGYLCLFNTSYHASVSSFRHKAVTTSTNGFLVGGYAGYLVRDRSTAFPANLSTIDPSGRYVINIGNPAADLTALKALIAHARQKVEADYTTESWGELQTVLIDAIALNASSPTQQEQVDAMCDRLQVALDGLQLKPPPLPDTTELEELLVYAKSIENEGYTSSSWSRLQSAIAAGDALLARSSYATSEVSLAISNLRSAINGLAIAPPPSTEPTGPTVPPGLPEPGGHRYMVDGFRLEDLLPAQEAIMENFGEARKFGIFVFVVMIVVFIITRLIRRMIGFEVVSFDDSGVLSSHTREVNFGHGLRDHHPNDIKRGHKYIDY